MALTTKNMFSMLAEEEKNFGSIRVFTSEDLKVCTSNFSEENLIGQTQFGKVYRGQIKEGTIGTQAQVVTVKIWDEKANEISLVKDKFLMVEEEVNFLTHPSMNHHPNLIKLIGYCCEEVKGVVYDLNPLDTLHNLVTRDDFRWLKRINVILEFARLLEFLHGHDQPYLVFNIDACHIMLDQDYVPILFDFGLLSGGIIGEMHVAKKTVWMSTGYVDPYFASGGISPSLLFL